MRYLAKLVTGILLITLSAMPAFAAIPCPQSAPSMPCCDGAMCPMMANMSSRGAVGHRGMKDAPVPCCRVKARSLVAVMDQRSPERTLRVAVLSESPAVVPMPLMQNREQGLTLKVLRRSQRTQATLCTFLI